MGGQNTIVNGLNEESNADDSKLTASYSLFESGETNYTGPNNLTATTSPFASTTATQLSPCSIAIDAGNPASTTATTGTTDLAGNPRFFNSRIDVGAYERQATPTVGIVQQPASGTSVSVGVTVAVSTTGTINAFQWYKNGTALTGVASATTAILTLTNVQPSDAGSYRLAVTGNCNSLTSGAFSLSVTFPIRYVRQGETATAAPGTRLQAICKARSTPPASSRSGWPKAPTSPDQQVIPIEASVSISKMGW